MEAAKNLKSEMMQVGQVQDWWSSEQGPSAASRSPVLAVFDAPLLAEVIAAGGGYHTILSADRLDGLHRQYGSSTDPALEPLRKALQARGGSKAQARALGMVLFREARALREQCLQEGAASKRLVAAVATPVRAAASPQGGASAARPSPQASPRGTAGDVKLDEVWPVPRRYVCSEAYPAGALMAARTGPSSRSELVAKLPSDFAYMATGRAGDWLEVQIDVNGVMGKGFVLHTIADQVMLVPATAPAAAEGGMDEAWSPPRRWVQAEGYPEGAQMAAKSAPSREGKQIATLPSDFEYYATGRSGDYLQVYLDLDGVTTAAYVPHTLGDLVLLKPAPQQQHFPLQQQEESSALLHLQQLQQQQQLHVQSQQQRATEAAAAAQVAAEAAASAARAASDVRVDALEAKVSLQDRQIQALQAELRQLRAQLTSAACALAPPPGS